jgi:hypothetical protein
MELLFIEIVAGIGLFVVFYLLAVLLKSRAKRSRQSQPPTSPVTDNRARDQFGLRNSSRK